MKWWEKEEKHWDEVKRQHEEKIRKGDYSQEYIQPWEGKSSPGSPQDQWNSFYKNTLEKKQQITVAPWETANYEDPHFLEHDNNITGPVYKYVPYDDLEERTVNFFGRHPLIFKQVGGWEIRREMLNQLPFVKVGHGYDTSGDAIRFSEAGGIGADRGGKAFWTYQTFDQEKHIIIHKDGTREVVWRGSGDGTEVNAARHTLWNMIHTNRFGINLAKEIADYHEANPYTNTDRRVFDPDDYKESSTNPNPKRCQFKADEPLRPEKCALSDADEVADLLNNRIGRNLGLGYAPETITNDLALGMLDYFYHYGLYTVKKIGGKYEVLKTKIKKEQYDHLKRVFTFELDDQGFEFGKNPRANTRRGIKNLIENYGYL